MRKENKILVTDIGEIDEVKVIFDDDNKPYLYSETSAKPSFIEKFPFSCV